MKAFLTLALALLLVLALLVRAALHAATVTRIGPCTIGATNIGPRLAGRFPHGLRCRAYTAFQARHVVVTLRIEA